MDSKDTETAVTNIDTDTVHFDAFARNFFNALDHEDVERLHRVPDVTQFSQDEDILIAIFMLNDDTTYKWDKLGRVLGRTSSSIRNRWQRCRNIHNTIYKSRCKVCGESKRNHMCIC